MMTRRGWVPFLAAVVAVALLVPSLLWSAETADAPSEVAAAFATSAVTGMQLSAKQGAERGLVPAATAACVQKLGPASLRDVFVSLLADLLNEDERRGAEAFFSTAVGRKYVRYGLVQLYKTAGETPPSALPAFSEPEYQGLEAFGRTPAGDKLLVKQVLNTPAAKGAIGERTRQLLKSCEGKA